MNWEIGMISRTGMLSSPRGPLLFVVGFTCIIALGLVLVLAAIAFKGPLRSRGAVRFAPGELSASNPRANAFIDLRGFFNAGRKTNWMGGGRIAGRDLAG